MKEIALDDVSLSVHKGEIICLVALRQVNLPLNMVADSKAYQRDILRYSIHKLNEEKVTLFRQKHFSAFHLLPMLTAVENVGLPLIFRGVDNKKRHILAKKMLEDVGLSGYEKRKPSQMSGGQQQRVGIARALVGNPKIIFADEPTGNLDSSTSVEVMEIMVKKVRENNQTLLIVTHDPTISEYADRIVTIKDGNILNIEENKRG